MARQRADVRGQIRLLEDYMTPEEVENLGTREIPAVTSRIESAELSSRWAEEVRRNPQAAGLASRIIRRLEILDPARYGGEEKGLNFWSFESWVVCLLFVLAVFIVFLVLFNLIRSCAWR